ncbi:MAG: hypothetical protein JXA23_06380 [Bacteroidales bacterium]|nr:hypothetical protein [Bacteroidales bacterium]
MKKVALFFSAFMISSILFSQTIKEEVDLFQAAFGMEKKAMVAAFVTPVPEQADAFWALYDEYETKRKELGKERMELLYFYAANYATLSSEEADLYTVNMIALQKRTDALLNTYYKKVKKVTNGIVATQFYQIELYILTAIRMEILENVPFIGE